MRGRRREKNPEESSVLILKYQVYVWQGSQRIDALVTSVAVVTG